MCIRDRHPRGAGHVRVRERDAGAVAVPGVEPRPHREPHDRKGVIGVARPLGAGPYTNLTLPTSDLVEISVGAGSLKKKKHNREKHEKKKKKNRRTSHRTDAKLQTQ